MGRLLAIDYGTKRTGIAVSDPLQIIANALDTVRTHLLMPYLKKYLAENNVTTIVVGKPTQMDGTPSESYRHVEPFFRKLQKEFPETEIVWYDERFTSLLAQKAMIDGGVKKMQRRDKALVDRVSATIILQSYMDSRAFGE